MCSFGFQTEMAWHVTPFDSHCADFVPILKCSIGKAIVESMTNLDNHTSNPNTLAMIIERKPPFFHAQVLARHCDPTLASNARTVLGVNDWGSVWDNVPTVERDSERMLARKSNRNRQRHKHRIQRAAHTTAVGARNAAKACERLRQRKRQELRPMIVSLYRLRR